ncbi:hypothetical protein OSB04_006905 [Centaurea solstitialis]|uniref:Uncharacterized protein n=1 Tax=Centaurea solstitialis TaxID=347529 RepID=A0AA38TVJ7_9ASTR|nr:hypothetical protein OSB04_006905 [Centaurea solstitialis]
MADNFSFSSDDEAFDNANDKLMSEAFNLASEMNNYILNYIRNNQETEIGLADDEEEDDDGRDANVNLKRKKSKRNKGEHEAKDEVKIQTVDYDDPANPLFKRSAAYAHRVINKHHKDEPHEKVSEDNVRVEADSKIEKHEMSSLPSEGKKSRRKGK